MKLLVLADIHGHLDYLIEIKSIISSCDGIVMAGDITDFGGAEQARHVIAALSDFGKPILAVPGNCDTPGVEAELHQHHISLHGGRIACGDLQFVGVGGALPVGSHGGENDFRRTLEKSVLGLADKDNLVLVTHQPAWGTQLDTGGSGRHGGSKAIREFIEQYQPILAVSGHIHEAYGVDQLGATTLVNPGPFCRGRYAVVDITGKHTNVQLFP